MSDSPATSSPTRPNLICQPNPVPGKNRFQEKTSFRITQVPEKPKTRRGQVHPTASRRLLFRPPFNPYHRERHAEGNGSFPFPNKPAKSGPRQVHPALSAVQTALATSGPAAPRPAHPGSVPRLPPAPLPRSNGFPNASQGARIAVALWRRVGGRRWIRRCFSALNPPPQITGTPTITASPRLFLQPVTPRVAISVFLESKPAADSTHTIRISPDLSLVKGQTSKSPHSSLFRRSYGSSWSGSGKSSVLRACVWFPRPRCAHWDCRSTHLCDREP
jgi:hypothetical protein